MNYLFPMNWILIFENSESFENYNLKTYTRSCWEQLTLISKYFNEFQKIFTWGASKMYVTPSITPQDKSEESTLIFGFRSRVIYQKTRTKDTTLKISNCNKTQYKPSIIYCGHLEPEYCNGRRNCITLASKYFMLYRGGGGGGVRN